MHLQPHYNWVDAVAALALLLVFGFRVAPKKTGMAVRWAWAAVKVVLAVALAPVLYWLFRASPNRLFLHAFTFLWPHNDIVKKGRGLYLRRFYLTPRIKGLPRWFLHFIARSDDDRDGHDHPWEFTSEILYGGYLEEVFFPRDQSYMDANHGRRSMYQCRTRGDVFTNPPTHVHKITLFRRDGVPVPAWTLVKRTWGEREWGFWELDPADASKDRWIPQSEYGGSGEYKSSWRPAVST